jgi:DNA-binding NtrC family response regulator/EAL domain-containing protein (putative c-di-GMP-specific phosphodiesterase class I)
VFFFGARGGTLICAACLAAYGQDRLSGQLRVLIVEDSENDAALVVRELAREGDSITFSRVENADEMRAALVAGPWDVILSDWKLPGFSGLEALAIAQATGLDIPFIIVSGSIHEDIAVAAMRAGAHDYVLKDRMARLGVAVHREIRERDVRASRREAETALRASQEVSRQAQKMEAVGLLAGGVAHDFNNVLTVVGMCSSVLEESLDADDPRRFHAAEITKAAACGATITRQLLTMSRHHPSEPRSIRIGDVVEQFQPMLRRLVRDQVTLTIHNADAPAVLADPVQIEQVLMNLAVNGRDAMPNGGRLTIGVSPVAFDDPDDARIRGLAPGTYVELAVTDTGCGMDAETQKRIFEPFFTTKAVGNGTGLGLAIVHGIVQQAGGAITVYSEVGRGTSVRVFVPVSTRSVDEDRPKPIAPTEIPAATILIVDDNDDVRGVAARILRGAGCTVLEASSGAESRRLAVSYDGRIDLVLCDVILSDVRGEQLVAQLRGLRPNIRSVLMSGYPAGALSSVAEGALEMLNKPFGTASLRAAIARGLEGWRAPTREEPVSAAAEDRVRVLLAEDDEPLRKLIVRSLRRSKFEVVEAGSGKAAAAAVQGQQFDVIVSDINMPDGTGLDLMRSVRRVDLDVPFILLSGDPDVKTATKAIEYGAFRFLIKPLDLDVLAKLFRHAARVHGLARLRREAFSIGGTRPGAIDRAGLEVRFELALDNLWMAYQPIVDAKTGGLYGLEALLRSEEPSMASPQALIGAATQIDGLPKLGRKIRALSAAALASRREVLFVNLHPDDLLDAELVDADSPLAQMASRVILEVTERAALPTSPLLAERIARLRTLGYRLAVDDIGAGYSGLASFAELVPEVVKIDMSLVRGVHLSTLKQRTIAAISRLCRESGTLVVCEGVETAEERDCVVFLGCDLLQGYLFGKPTRELPALRERTT